MKAETVAALQDARTKRRAVVLATRLSDAAETLVYPDKAEGVLASDANLLSAARRAMEIGRSETVDIAGQSVLVLKDVVSSGVTEPYLEQQLRNHGAREVRFAEIGRAHV